MRLHQRVLSMWRTGQYILPADFGFNPKQIFASGVQGAFYRERDISTLYLDYPPTVPVTGMEQQVATMLDKSGRGNHAFQATSTKRPVYSRRVNLLTKTEDFSDAAFVPTNLSVTANAATAKDGTLTADKLTPSSVNGLHAIVSAGVNNQVSCRHSVYVQAAGYSKVGLKETGTTGQYASFDLATGTVLNSWPGVLPTIDAIGGGIYRIGYTATSASPSGQQFKLFVLPPTYTAGDPNGVGWTGDGVSGIYAWGADLRLAIYANLPYQRVNTATDYDDNAFKFPTYLTSDGIDDSYSSATGGGGNAGFFFSQAITVLGGAGTARTLFSDAGTNTGYIVRLNTSNQLELAAGNGTAYTTIATAGTLAVGTTDVVQAWDDGVNLNVKIGTGAIASVARPVVVAGTAGFTLGQDNGASSGYFNGRVYSTVYTKDTATTQAQRDSVAAYQRVEAFMP